MRVHYHSSERMPEVADGSVQAVVCSPPYWDLKDYGHDDQIGHGEPYGRYHERMDRVWAECFRVLRDDGTAWIVIDKVWSKGAMVPIPFDIAMRCEGIGFTLLDLLVWNKPTSIAGMHPRNLVNKHETVVVLGKRPSGAFLHLDVDLPPPDAVDGRLSDLWRIPVKAGSLRRTPDHKAPYPRELMERILRASTREGDVVLDPFAGSGTTLKVARALGRCAVGYEINEAFAPLIEATE